MTTIMTTRAGLAIAASTLATILLASTASAGNVHGAAPKYTVTKAAPAASPNLRVPGGLLNQSNLGQSILHGQNGTQTQPAGGKPGSGGGNKNPGSGGTVVSCHPGTGCTQKPSGDRDHDGHDHDGHDHDYGHDYGHGYGRYWWRWYRGYGYWPVVYTAPDFVDGCAFEYRERVRFIPGIGFRRVRVKYCIATI